MRRLPPPVRRFRPALRPTRLAPPAERRHATPPRHPHLAEAQFAVRPPPGGQRPRRGACRRTAERRLARRGRVAGMRGALGEWADGGAVRRNPPNIADLAQGGQRGWPVRRLQRAGGPRRRAAGGDMRLGPPSPGAADDISLAHGGHPAIRPRCGVCGAWADVELDGVGAGAPLGVSRHAGPLRTGCRGAPLAMTRRASRSRAGVRRAPTCQPNT